MPFNWDLLRNLVDPKVTPFAWKVAARVTGGATLDCIIGVRGPRGKGKSTFSIYLAEHVAKYLALIKDNDITKWPNYFDISTHIATVDKKGTKKLLTAVRGNFNNIFILDDVSISWNSRTFMSRENRMLNDIITIMRTYRCVLILNMVDERHVDIVPRTMFDYLCNLEDTYYNLGMSRIKIVTQEKNMFFDHTYPMYLRNKEARITDWVSFLPSPEVKAAYDKMRFDNTDKLIEDLVSFTNEPDKPFKAKRENYTREVVEPHLRELVKRGNLNIKEMSDILGIDRQSITKYIKELGLPYKIKLPGRPSKKPKEATTNA